jgi:Concanavalin A-like lectin/glucanases superfamily/Pectate lyase superfamily protein
MSSKRMIRRVLAVLALATAVAVLQVDVSAQNLPPPGAYQPIPNFTGVGAGAQFRSIAPATLGPAAALINGQPEGALAALAFSGTTVLASARVSDSVVGSGSSASLSKLNVNGVYNVMAYGAKGDGVTDDSPKEQAAIDAACAATHHSATISATVYWPSPPAVYYTPTPLFVHCSNLRLLGPGKSTTSYQMIGENTPTTVRGGPGFVFQPYSMSGVTLGAPLISGSIHSANFNGGTHYYVNLNDAFDPFASPGPLQVSGKSAATIDAYFKPAATTAGNIVCSSGGKTNGLITSAFCIGINSSAEFAASMTINGTSYTLTDTSTTVTVGTLYDEQLTYDGTTIRFFTNGALVASSAHSGRITQPWYEVMTVGGGGAFPYPENSPYPIKGLVDGVQISSIARNTSTFTPCNCEPTNDSNSLIIASFDNNLHMLTRLLFKSGGANVSLWSYVRRGNEDSGAGEMGVTGIEMDGISHSGGRGSVGIIGQGIYGSSIRHSTFIEGLSGIYQYSNDAYLTLDDDYLSSGYIDLFTGGQSGFTTVNNSDLVGGLVGWRVQDSSVVCNGTSIQLQSNAVFGYSIEGDSGFSYFNANGCGSDNENPGSNFLGNVHLDSVETTMWNGGAISGSFGFVGAPAVYVDGGGGGFGLGTKPASTFTGVNFGGTYGFIPELIYVANPSSSGIVDVINPFVSNTSAFQWTNAPGNVLVSPCRGNVTLSSGRGYFSGQCVMTSAVCTGQDTTTSVNTFVLGAVSAGRQVTDGVTSTSTSLVSASASFTTGDVGRQVGGAGINTGTYIASVTNSTTVVLSAPTTATATGVTVVLDGVVPITSGTGSDVIRVRCE